ncbi:glutathione synthetase [Spizellomyces punctatus DAOM BR117]|uniref:Glutathione synthetase n=1 Tax=Spizellomyces punctatus (strain DAOM BR117) TaxID=645134 RepID=A0A0L0HKV1_SPIPD|nr:glutathione synthetase [Spizellomyces punctatus DAOM BR117]KND01668.1 glutathione synthetase [Spizellomyces punctatus DAOM BR117]|eukprot:XP_016609707.1 glutathione synthetase [Spizellomyces punctatus DAOM BR117]
MSSSTLPAYPPPLAQDQLDELKDHAVDWALAHGFVVRPPPSSVGNQTIPVVTHAPFALFPSPFPRRCYEQALKLQPLFNALVESVANDDLFLRETLESLSKVDDFVGRLYDIYKHVQQEGVAQPITLGLHRSDYLLHVPLDAPPKTEPVLQQVELNTIASSFSSLSHLAGDLHNFLVNRTNYFNDSSLPSPDITLSALPRNSSIKDIAKGIAKAWSLYGSASAVVIMIVQPGERNAFDQRWIEYNLFYEHKIRLIRCTLAEIADRGTLQGDQRKLFVGQSEVAVTYFRAGYAPTDFPSQKEWDARLLIERSRSVKCPNIAYHLVGTKKVQQILAKPGLLERFVPDARHAKMVRDSFTGLYSLDGSPAGEAAAKMALENPEGFVMKPQREGGGNNIYGEDIPKALSKMSVSERNAYILMDLIRPPPLENIMVRQGQLIKGEVVSELGIYGLWVSDGSVVHMNETGGHLLRTKASTSHEGGVAAGFAVLDSPLLI